MGPRRLLRIPTREWSKAIRNYYRSEGGSCSFCGHAAAVRADGADADEKGPGRGAFCPEGPDPQHRAGQPAGSGSPNPRSLIPSPWPLPYCQNRARTA
jgi:hypothetical protein